MPSGTHSTSAATAATFTAVAMIANQVAGKATRDALFLSAFDVTSLPYMFIAASLFSLVMVLLFSRILTRFGPSRVLPLSFAASAVLLFGEWLVLRRDTRLASVLLYLHMAGLGSILISGFWSVVNERFDPRA